VATGLLGFNNVGNKAPEGYRRTHLLTISFESDKDVKDLVRYLHTLN